MDSIDSRGNIASEWNDCATFAPIISPKEFRTDVECLMINNTSASMRVKQLTSVVNISMV